MKITKALLLLPALVVGVPALAEGRFTGECTLTSIDIVGGQLVKTPVTQSFDIDGPKRVPLKTLKRPGFVVDIYAELKIGESEDVAVGYEFVTPQGFRHVENRTTVPRKFGAEFAFHQQLWAGLLLDCAAKVE